MLYKENVLVGDEGQPLITDFALAKACRVDLPAYKFLISLFEA
jgi:hypothetical protein